MEKSVVLYRGRGLRWPGEATRWELVEMLPASRRAELLDRMRHDPHLIGDPRSEAAYVLEIAAGIGGEGFWVDTARGLELYLHGTILAGRGLIAGGVTDICELAA